MKKVLFIALAVVSSQAFAYQIKVKNDVKYGDIQVTISFTSDFKTQNFMLKPGESRVIRNIPATAFVDQGIQVRGIKGEGMDQGIVFQPYVQVEQKLQRNNIDIEVEYKNGQLKFDKELF